MYPHDGMEINTIKPKDFIKNVLGCGCPEEVFASMVVDRLPAPAGSISLAFKISVGGRLMILGVADDHIRASADALADLVATGARLRDDGGFNRLRIVVISADTSCEAVLRRCFEGIKGVDDRIHLHVVEKGVIEEMLAGS